MNLYFRNIRVVDPAQNLDERVDLWLKDGEIRHCSKEDIAVDMSARVIEADTMIASPGFLDMHVHLREPGFEYKETIKTGTDSAANGGFTSVVCMPNTEPAIDDITVVEYIKSKSKGLLTDVLISGAISQKREGKLISPMLELAEAGVVLFTDDGSSVESSEMMKRAFDYAATRDLLLSQHCEDHSLTKNFSMNETELSMRLGLKGYPSVAEEIIVSRDIQLAEYSGNRRLHLQHLSTKGSIELVRKAKARGLRVSCEVAPHHFVLPHDILENYDTNHKMNPPLRSNEDIEAIIEGLVDGTVDCIATDHAPHALHEKDVEYEKAPNGIVGLETSIGLVLTKLYHEGKLDIKEIVSKMSVNPRKVLGLDLPKIAVGEKANLTIFAPDEEWIVNKNNLKSLSKNTPFDGYKLKGKPKFAVNNNQYVESSL